MKFEELGLNEALLEAISYMGFETATPIQARAIPKILAGKDLIACAQTGTGKSAAFILPLLHQLAEKQINKVRALVLVPTRELAIQLEQQIQGLSYFIGVHSAAIYGGVSGDVWELQKKALQKGTDIIVATPGKLLGHLNWKYADFSHLEHLILDEADRMLDMGFREDIIQIIDRLPRNRQTLMFSATMPPKIRGFAGQILNNPSEISIAISKPAAGVLQAAYVVYDHQKVALLNRLIKDKPNYESILIFSSTKKKVSEIVQSLKRENYNVAGISSNLTQDERKVVLSDFRSKRTRVLVATDVLSRGIDIKSISLVINFDVPGDAEDYVHRVGRTARADRSGVALTFVNPADKRKFRQIEYLIEKEVMKIPLPPDLGEAPDWKSSGGRNKNRSGSRGGYKKKKSNRKSYRR